MRCNVAGCGKSNQSKASEISFFHFPSNASVRKKWLKFCRREKDFNPKVGCICMDHFKNEDFENSLQYQMGFTKKRILRRGAVPTIFKPDVENKERIERVQRRENKKIISQLLAESEALAAPEEIESSVETVECFMCTKAGNLEDPDFLSIETNKVTASQKLVPDVLQHLANCIKVKLIFQPGAKVCRQCFLELEEYDSLMLLLMTQQKRLTLQLQTILNERMENFDLPDESEMQLERTEFYTDEQFIRLDEDLVDEDPISKSEPESETDRPPRRNHNVSMSDAERSQLRQSGFLDEGDTDSERSFDSSPRSEHEECFVCGKHFETELELQNHITIMHDSKVYSCKICGVVCRDEEYLELHMNIHEGKTENECRFCSKQFARPLNTVRHMRKHWDKKKYQCEKCGECFSLDNMLYNHRLRHEAEENPITCSVCHKTLKSRKTLKRHILLHQDRPRHFCSICSKSFTERYTLKSHMKLHTETKKVKEIETTLDENPPEDYEMDDEEICVICSVTFENKEALENHLECDHDVILK